jgi:hypothetical protein
MPQYTTLCKRYDKLQLNLSPYTPYSHMGESRYSRMKASDELHAPAVNPSPPEKRAPGTHWKAEWGVLEINKIQTRQPMYCTYHVTRKRVRVIKVSVEKRKYLLWVCVCILALNYLTCKAHAPYYVITLYRTVSHHIISQTAWFSKEKRNKMRDIDFLYNFYL